MIPNQIYCLKPHPYLELGAPYSSASDPWRLREGVINRLIKAQEILKEFNTDFTLGIFDAWRPIKVQSFMVEHSINKECSFRNIDRDNKTQRTEFKKVVEDVSKFWAPPNIDPSSPPPHSTGGAIDLTFITSKKHQVDMGGAIDHIGSISNPNYYEEYSSGKKDSKQHIWHLRRSLLSRVMNSAGFAQHPFEWWHFSYGDQLWASLSNSKNAIYGSVEINH